MAYAEDKVLDPYKAVTGTFLTGLLPDLNGHTSRTGALTCFCQQEFARGASGDTYFEVDGYNGGKMRYQVCKQYA